ncbi:MAG: hypothetical protein LBK73_14130 [Treponema sp.]|jgi:hypothetical protein|nr:hypothetical protein [Treponema sp.]
MVPKPFMVPRLNTVWLSEPLAQTQDRLVDIPLKFYRVVKGVSDIESVLIRLRQPGILGESAERDTGLVVNLDLFGACPRFAFELFGGREEVERRSRRLADSRQESCSSRTSRRPRPAYSRTTDPFFCSTKQLAVRRTLFFRLEFYRSADRIGRDFPNRPFPLLPPVFLPCLTPFGCPSSSALVLI